MITPVATWRVTVGVSLLIAAGSMPIADQARAQATATNRSVSDLRRMSLEELMDVEVTSVSRRPQELRAAASAIQVVSRDDIRRSGATTIPQALRLAPNLQTAQVNASQWAISSRGFNNVLANKLLVLMDGRAVYTPLYAGVFWDVQDTLLEDIDHIEVISGPGGALWGANAVNGVINITTRNARDTHGLFAQAGGGSGTEQFGALRYGGELTPDLHYRGYAKTFALQESFDVASDGVVDDHWGMSQGGFRMDWQQEDDLLTLQSDYYRANPNPEGLQRVSARGGNLLGRWTRTFSDTSDLQLQLYYDKTDRNFNNGFRQELTTYDAEWQHSFLLTQNQQIVWGLDVRRMEDGVRNLPMFGYLPEREVLDLYSAFVQDEIMLGRDWRLTLGSKFEYNHYTNFEYQPNVRLAWAAAKQQTVWAAVSRAVRTPSRTDSDFFASAPLPGTPIVLPLILASDFQSEDVVAYELGWRLQPQENLSVALSTFFNQYDQLRSAEPGTVFPPFPLTFGNGVEGDTYGMELAVTYQYSDWWRLRGGYTFLKKDLRVKPSSRDQNNATVESNDPQNQVVLQSVLNLADNFEADLVLRYVDALPNPRVSSHTGLDIHLGWNITNRLKLSVVGQDLLDRRQLEFIPANPGPREIERAVYGQIIWQH